MKKLLALVLAIVMVLGLAACGTPADPTTQPTTKPTTEPTTEPTTQPTDPAIFSEYPKNPDDSSVAALWSETETPDGYNLVVNEGGDTLTYTPGATTIIQVDGYAFKDHDHDGVLDLYEDWRCSSEDRAADLVNQITDLHFLAGLTSHGGLGTYATDELVKPEDEAGYDDPQMAAMMVNTITFLEKGGRGGVTRNASNGDPAGNAKWNNLMQEYAESLDWGIPVMISVDPLEISGMVESVGLAATMNTELAFQIGVETAKQYRAIGISALLGPQIDLATPVMDRASGTYGEDPALVRDITKAYINGLQSTWAEDGTDLGWGSESVYAFTKHFAGAGAAEGGRNDHNNPGRYSVFPGDNYEAHIIAYFDGAFALDGLTGSAGVMPQYAVNVDSEGNPMGGEFGASYNPYVMNLLNENWDGLAVTDWGIVTGTGGANWGVENMTHAEAVVLTWERQGDLLGGFGDMTVIYEAADLLVEKYGETEAKAILADAVLDFIEVEMNLELFENPYCDTEYANSIVNTEEAKAYGLSTQVQSIVMLKNDGTIKAAGDEKLTVYVPYQFSEGSTGSSGSTPAGWSASIDIAMLEKYFNVVTDTVLDPSGVDADGEAVHTEDDIARASAEQIAACDLVIVSMSAPKVDSSIITDEEGNTIGTTAPSIQYRNYTADSEYVRQESIGGKVTVNYIYDNYGSIISKTETKENRSYYGQSSGDASSIGDLEMLEYVASVAGETPVVVTMQMKYAMCWHEVEPLADVILVSYGDSERTEALLQIISGQVEPSGLLCGQQPANMEAVEKQLEDVPRDMECYVDAAGNTYDFAFGMNWSGVINDERVQTYGGAEALTDCENVDYDAYEAANK